VRPFENGSRAGKGVAMIGAIGGDIIGSVYERHNTKTMDFPLFDRWCTFTDDTVMTAAIADAILSGHDYGTKLKEWYRLYPDRGYGPGFRRWAASDRAATRHSMGNGSAMRAIPIGFAFGTLEVVLEEAKKSAEPSHNHPEGIKGAQAVAAAVFLAQGGKSKAEIKEYVEGAFGYNLGTASTRPAPAPFPRRSLRSLNLRVTRMQSGRRSPWGATPTPSPVSPGGSRRLSMGCRSISALRCSGCWTTG
jgi:ADP-ribosylglycohydrolase